MSLTNSPYWFGGGVDSFYPTQINDSLRFEDGSSAYLNRTPSSAGNRRAWTWSGWVKRSNISINSFIFGCGSSGTNFAFIGFDSANKIDIRDYQGSYTYSSKTSQLFRDTSAWYHLVLAADMNNSTAADRIKLYVNGERVTSFNSAPSPTTKDLVTNSAIQHVIGAGYYNDGSGLNSYFDGYLSDINFIDGQALDASSFGETKDSVWIPKSYSGSYGTNGFYLKFNGNTNDTSGNSNNWTANNISAHDYVPDSPTNNFATMNSVEASSGVSATLSEGNLKTVGTTVSYSGGIASTFEQSSGKWYWEVYVNSEVTAGSNFYSFVGAATGDNNLIHKSNNSQIPSVVAGVNGWSWEGDGTINLSGTGTKAVSSVTAPSVGSVLGFAIDLDNGNVYFYHNGTAQNSGNAVITGVTGLVHNPMVGVYNGSTVTFNFGQDSTFAGATTAGGNTDANGIGDFKHPVPSGFLALASANLPDPSIISGSEYFNTVLYSGNGGTQNITGVGFQPNLVWVKNRDKSDRYHLLTDTVRGATKSLASSLTSNEAGTTYSNGLTSFDTDGFSVGNLIDFNGTDDRIVSWNWKAGTAFSNSAGTNGATIASSGRVNTDAGFSIVSWTGNSTNSTVYHALDKAPELIIAKNRDTSGTEWPVLETLVNGATHYLRLNESYASTNTSIIWNNTNPTSNVFSIGTYSYINENLKNIIAYCFHSVSGYSKVGSYTGGGSNFPFVFTGFRPSFLLIKSATYSSTNWLLFDNKREIDNPVELELNANNANQEYNNARDIDFVSNGFKIRSGTNNNLNTSGGSYIYLAFAESPQKYANAR